MPDFMTEVALALLFPAIGLYVLYWVIRLAVRHGLRDAHNESGSLVESRHGPAAHPAHLRR